MNVCSDWLALVQISCCEMCQAICRMLPFHDDIIFFKCNIIYAASLVVNLDTSVLPVDTLNIDNVKCLGSCLIITGASANLS